MTIFSEIWLGLTMPVSNPVGRLVLTIVFFGNVLPVCQGLFAVHNHKITLLPFPQTCQRSIGFKRQPLEESLPLADALKVLCTDK